MQGDKIFTERREHERASVQNIVLGILNSGELETIGSVTNISLGGAKCTFDDLRMAPNDKPIHSIDLIADSHYLFDIPCQYAWCSIGESDTPSKWTNLKHCGIQFGNLNPNQIFLLRGFINRCSSHGLKNINANISIAGN